jgi:hypothetical protein
LIGRALCRPSLDCHLQSLIGQGIMVHPSEVFSLIDDLFFFFFFFFSFAADNSEP